MRIYYCKERTILHFLNKTEDEKWVSEMELGSEYDFYPLNLPIGELMIVPLYKTDIASWGNWKTDASNRGGFQVFISLQNKNMFGIYGDNLVVFDRYDYSIRKLTKQPS